MPDDLTADEVLTTLAYVALAAEMAREVPGWCGCSARFQSQLSEREQWIVWRYLELKRRALEILTQGIEAGPPAAFGTHSGGV